VSEIDWFAMYKETLEADSCESTMNAAEVEVLIADIIAGRISAPALQRSRRSRRRWIAAGVAISVIAGGATAAALLNRSKPDRPQEGIACHAAADLTTGAVVIPPTKDPLEACVQLWLEGSLPDIDHGGPATDAAPPMFACVDPGGGLSVFPNLSEPTVACSDLGLVDAVTDLSADPLVILQDRLTNDINLTCVDLGAAHQLAQAALTDIGLDDWTITIRDNANDCVKAGQDPDAKTVFLQSVPN
jgi:hypothetical protein